MTDPQIEQAEKDAREDAEWLLLMVLLSKNVSFNAEVGRFYVDGRSVSINQIRSYLNRIERRVGKRVINLTNDLSKGRLTTDEWKRGFDRNITSIHVLTGALALGSIASAVRNTDVQGRIDSELRYADGFAQDIRDKKGTADQHSSRAKSYMIAATITYGILEQLSRGLMSKFTEARRIRRASESCPGCVDYAYRWMPINELPPIGSLQCRSRCRCFIEYR
jgi:hypothetical protein